MRAGVTIFILCALIVLGASTQARADIALCNHFMALVARARGDATEEFKRRIAFLLETGKIGESELARMAASETAVSPFQTDRHQSADILPHARAFDELIGKEGLNWDEVKQFISDTQGELKRDGEKREVHEKETEVVVYPHIVGAISMKFIIYDTPTIFEYKGTRYAVLAAENYNYYVIDLLTGRVVRSVQTGASPVATPLIFIKNGEPYLFIGSKDFQAIVTPALQNVRPAKISMEWGIDTGAAAYTVGGMPYFATASHIRKSNSDYGELYLIDASRNKRVVTIELSGGVPKLPAVFESKGVPYVLVPSEPNHIEIVNAATGKITHHTTLPKAISGEPVIFKNGKQPFFAIAAEKGTLYVGKALTGEVTQTVRIRGEDELSSPVSFEHAGTPYLVVSGGRGSDKLFVINALTGEVVKRIVSKEATPRPPAVFEIKGVPYFIIGSDSNEIYITEALTGKTVQTVLAKDWSNARPVVFESNGSYQAVVVLHDNSLSTIWLGGVLSKKEGVK